jgi:hypothetical protein
MPLDDETFVQMPQCPVMVLLHPGRNNGHVAAVQIKGKTKTKV